MKYRIQLLREEQVADCTPGWAGPITDVVFEVSRSETDMDIRIKALVEFFKE